MSIIENQISEEELFKLERLPNLISLYLKGNMISSLKFLKNLTSLNTLDLSDNNIFEIKEIKYLLNLKSLNLKGNKVTDISSLENLPSLELIDLSNNLIKEIRGIKKLLCLKVLILNHNQISDIKVLEYCKSISSLELIDNRITDVTPLLHLIKKGILITFNEKSEGIRDYLNILDNPIKTPPLHILKQGNNAVLSYFEAGELIALNECKLIFIGDGGVGKTCLMKRLVFNIFDPNEKQTHGINKIAWKEFLTAKGEYIKLNLWDFGGQDIQHSLHQFFFSERVIYVLVIDPRNDTRSDYWLEQIEKLGSDSEVLVVYNWKDTKDIEANFLNKFYELKKKYTKLGEAYLLSAKSGDGIDHFKVGLHQSVLKNEGLVQEYPQKWYNIKQKLEEIVVVGKENYVYYETYQNWCSEFDYTDSDEQRTLLKILNKIGSIVYFDRPVLNRNTILNPEWITTGAYAILTSPITNTKKGQLTETDLKEIFKETKEIFSNTNIKIKYDEHQFQYIIQLMIEYNLCQENPIVRREYLIPSAFGSKPEKSYEIHKFDSVRYRIQFDSPFEMLIIHKFIAKNIVKSFDKNYWHSGIYIKDSQSETYALIETSQHSFRIDFWLKGDSILIFWENIRRDFQEIFSIYAKFKYREEVLYKQDNIEVFLPYEEMLNSLKNGVKVIGYHPTYQLKNIEVEKVISLFEDFKITEKKINLEKNWGNEIKNILDLKNEKVIEIYKDAKFKSWKFRAMFLFIISLFITILFWYCYINQIKFPGSINFWATFKNRESIKWISIVSSFIWNGFIGKMLYERYYDPSKEKAFREIVKIPESIPRKYF